MLVCATGQSDAAWPVLDANGYYHTNFKLDSAGEYLALLAPDGSTVFEYPNGFPPQLTDISYGKAQYTTTADRFGACRRVEGSDGGRCGIGVDGSIVRRFGLDGRDDAAGIRDLGGSGDGGLLPDERRIGDGRR